MIEELPDNTEEPEKTPDNGGESGPEREMSPEAAAMAAYLESDGFRERMADNFTKDLKALLGTKDISWQGEDYSRELGRETTPHAKIQNMIDSYGRTASPITRDSMLPKILERFITEEQSRRYKAYPQREELGPNPFLDTRSIVNDFFAPLQEYRNALPRIRELEARREDLKNKLATAQRMKVPKHMLRESPADIQRQLGETKKELASLQVVSDARVLAHFIPGYEKDFTAWKESHGEGADDPEGAFIAEHGTDLLNGLHQRLEGRQRKKYLAQKRRDLKRYELLQQKHEPGSREYEEYQRSLDEVKKMLEAED